MQALNQVTMKWGAISAAIIITFFLVSYFVIGGGSENYRLSEIVGYANIVLSLLVIFAAINEYRKMQADQRVSFAKGMAIGLLISTVAGTMFGIYNWVYVTYLEPDFMEQYYSYYIDQIRNSGQSAEAIEQQIQGYESQKDFFASPLVQFATMFFTVFVVGVIISLFSAGVQSRMTSRSE